MYKKRSSENQDKGFGENCLKLVCVIRTAKKRENKFFKITLKVVLL